MNAKTTGASVRRLLAVLLTVTMLLSVAVPCLADETDAGTAAGAGTSSSGTTATPSTDETTDYESYLQSHQAGQAGKDVTVPVAVDGVYDIENMADAEVLTAEQDKDGVLEGRSAALLLTESGSATFRFTVPETALYSIRLEYHGYNSDISKGSNIERRLLVDGTVPYEEAEYVTLRRVFKDVYRTDANGDRLLDVNGNDIRPGQEEVFQWITQDLYDAEGYCTEPLQFYLTAGEHTITLESQREAMLLYSITLFGQEELPSYTEVKAEYDKNGYKPAAGEIQYIQAEDLTLKSEKSNYPLSDRSSAATMPQDAFCTKLNYIGGEKWQNNGSWVEWNITVPETGLYKMVLRYKQDIYSGVKITRRLTINGEVPFAEAANLTFDYSSSWDTVTLGDGKGKKGANEEDYYFYFEAGQTYALRMEAVLGDMGDLLNRVSAAMDELNTDYRTILMITGSKPDKYRSYDFENQIPDTLENMAQQAAVLESVVDELVALTGETGERTATLTKMAAIVRQMTDDPFVIAAKFTMFKDNLSSLGTWILQSTYQPMKLDYIALIPDNTASPKAGAGFFAGLAFNVKTFISSFVIDYQSVGTTSTDEDTTSSITVWVTSGRDQSNIIRNLIDTSFTPEYNISVNLQLVTASAVLPCVLAGRGPDVCVGVASGDPINYAVRQAVLPLNEYEGFDEVCQRFHSSALVPYTFMGTTYALPETQTFNMMFVRTDIFEELNLEVPNTWTDLELLIPELQKRNMSIGLGHSLGELLMFMYQKDSPLYLNDGASSNLDSPEASTAFTQLCEYFTLYDFPTEYDAANRFRSGEMPLLIGDYGLYNQLSLFAPEIRGDWAMYEIPGTEQEDGSINRSETSGGTAVAMFRGCVDTEAAWTFMQWWTSDDTMLRYGNEMETAMNGSGRQAIANVNALSSMAWSTTDLNNILSQWEKVVGTPEVPGSYYTTRVVSFAFSKVYNDNEHAGDTLQTYIESLNAELTRKRSEFGL